MSRVQSLVEGRLDLWNKVAIADYWSADNRFFYSAVEYLDLPDGTLTWKHMKVRPFTKTLLKAAPIFYGRKYGGLSGFLTIPKEIKEDFRNMNIREAKEIQALVYQYRRDTTDQG